MNTCKRGYIACIGKHVTNLLLSGLADCTPAFLLQGKINN